VAGLTDDEVATVLAALDDEGARTDVQATIRAIQDAGVTGVPYFVIDDAIGLSGGQPAEVFRRAFEEAASGTLVSS